MPIRIGQQVKDGHYVGCILCGQALDLEDEEDRWIWHNGHEGFWGHAGCVRLITNVYREQREKMKEADG